MRETFNVFSYDKFTNVLITPKIIRADPELRNLKPKARQCFFEDEKKLEYFKIYSKHLCELECLSFIILDYCKCVPFHLPRNDSIEICNIKGMDCTVKFQNLDFHDYKQLYLNYGNCDCLDTCDSITYSYEIVGNRYNDKFSNE
jgi:acid-sensing ion channel, other